MHTLTCICGVVGTFSDKKDPTSPGRAYGWATGVVRRHRSRSHAGDFHPGQRLVPATHEGPPDLGPHHVDPLREPPPEGRANPVVLGREPGRVELLAQPGGEAFDLGHQITPMRVEEDRIALEKRGA